MMEKATMVLMFVMLVGIYFLGCMAVVLFITKNIMRWLKR
nr:MAG TPA: protein of unknown function DUF4969 [Caudoviricetes sp.]